MMALALGTSSQGGKADLADIVALEPTGDTCTMDEYDGLRSDEGSTIDDASDPPWSRASSGDSEDRVLVADCIADVNARVDEAELLEEKPRHGDGHVSVVQVGAWHFHGHMTVIYDGGQSLANSVVRKALVSSSAVAAPPTTVAVKAVSRHTDAEGLAMIRRERDILGGLGNSHPHILPMLSFAELAAECVLLTPFASHGDLSQHLRVGCECVEEREAHRLTLQLMAALSHLHTQRIVHGDVMPKNIFLTWHQDAYLAQLADFGLAVRLGDDSDSVHMGCVQGSHGYLSPEMIERKELSRASDLFALGVMIFQLLGGHDPFYPPSQVFSSLEFDEACWSPISEEATHFVVQLLAVEPAARGTSEAHTHQWLAIEDSEVTCATRGAFSPQPVPGLHFHSLVTSRSLWEAVRP
jgi:serine/threonine protein kinase